MKVTLDDGELKMVLENLGGIDPGRVVTAGTFMLAKRAKKATPRSKNRKNRSGKVVHTGGALANSIRTEVSGGSGTVGYTVEYAPHVEFGHRTVGGGYVEGQHFLKKAMDETEPEIKKALKRAIEEAER